MAIVYIFQAEGTTRVKIGRTGSLQQRQHAIHTASPFPVKLLRAIETPDAVQLEGNLHHRYRQYRVHREWFEFPPDVLQVLLEEPFSPKQGSPLPPRSIFPSIALERRSPSPTPVSPEYALVHLIGHHVAFRAQVIKQLTPESFHDSDLRALYTAVREHTIHGEPTLFPALLLQATNARQTALVTQMAQQAPLTTQQEVWCALQECMTRIRQRLFKARRQQIIAQLRMLGPAGDGTVEQQHLLQEYNQLSRL